MTGWLWTGRKWKPVTVLGSSRKPGWLRVVIAGQTTPRLVEQRLVKLTDGSVTGGSV